MRGGVLKESHRAFRTRRRSAATKTLPSRSCPTEAGHVLRVSRGRRLTAPHTSVVSAGGTLRRAPTTRYSIQHREHLAGLAQDRPSECPDVEVDVGVGVRQAAVVGPVGSCPRC